MKLRLSFFRPSTSFGELKNLSRNFDDPRSLTERTSSVSLGLAAPIRNWHTDFLFDYCVFPQSIMRFDAEWRTLARRMAVGDVILQRALLPPVGFGFCLEFAVRVCRIIDGEKRLGFGYETLEGHAERGESEFYFEELDGAVTFTIHTRSEPGHWSSRLGKHVFTLPYQAWCTRRALEQVRRRFHLENKHGNHRQ